MAHGKNAERAGHCGKDYWSRRLPERCPPWGKESRERTHRYERQQARREMRQELIMARGIETMNAG